MDHSCSRRTSKSNAVAALPLAVVTAALLLSFGADACTTMVGNTHYARCRDLGAQGASIAYTYQRRAGRLDVAFTGHGTSPSGWVGWGINPSGWGMVGSSVLVAFQAHNGTNVLPFKLSPAVQAGMRLQTTAIDFPIIAKRAIIQGSSFTIFASLLLRPSQSTALNFVWNRGSAVSGFSPLPHSLLPQDLRGFTSIDVAE